MTKTEAQSRVDMMLESLKLPDPATAVWNFNGADWHEAQWDFELGNISPSHYVTKCYAMIEKFKKFHITGERS